MFPQQQVEWCHGNAVVDHKLEEERKGRYIYLKKNNKKKNSLGNFTSLIGLYLFAGRHQPVLLHLGGEGHEVLQRRVHISQFVFLYSANRQQHHLSHDARRLLYFYLCCRSKIYLIDFLAADRLYHVLSEEEQPGAVEPLAALLAALQHLLPRDKDGAGHLPRAHGLMGKQRPGFAGLENKH